MDNRITLLECALTLFSSRGYDAVGVQEICDMAGVTKPTLYHYFISKRGLLQALLDAYFNPFLNDLEQAAGYQGDITLSLERVIRIYFAFAIRSMPFYRLQLAMRFSPQESEAYQAVAPFNKRQTIIVEDLFIMAATDHGNMQRRAKTFAATFLGLISTTINLSYDQSIPLDDDLLYKIQHQFMHGIFS